MNYTIEEIKAIAVPIAQKYGIRGMSLFGDYARGEASEDSDVDLYVDAGGNDNANLTNKLANRMAFVQELETHLSCHVNVVYTGMKDEELIAYIRKAEIVLY